MWLFAMQAFAIDWYLESPERADRSEPAAVEEAAVAAGFDARVVRRFTEGQGWRYVARVEGFADAPSARVAARELAEATGVAFVVIELSDGKTSPISKVPAGSSSDAAHSAPEAAVDPKEAAKQLAQVVAAHGAGAAFRASLAKGPVRFEYRRTLPDGRVASHRWGKLGGEIYVEVSGDVPARKLKVSRDRAELSVGGAPFAGQRPEAAMAIVSSLGPAEVIPVILGLEEAVANRREFQEMAITGAGEIGGVETILLGFGGDGTSGAIDLEIGAKDHLLRKVTFDGGARAYELSDHRAVSGAMLPFSVVERREGEIVGRVQIDLFQVGISPPSEWFGVGR